MSERKRRILEEWRARQPERDRMTRQLVERIAYHEAKLAEEQLERERHAERRRFWRFRWAS